MFLLKLAFVALIAVVAANSEKQPEVEIVTEKTFVRQDGYNFLFKTSDGVSRQEEGNLITVGEHQGIGIKGSYSYIGSDGQQYLVNFVADEKGYRPEVHVSPAQN